MWGYKRDWVPVFHIIEQVIPGPLHMVMVRLSSTASGMCQCVSAFQASGCISFTNISLATVRDKFALHSRGGEIDSTLGQEDLQQHTVKAWL